MDSLPKPIRYLHAEEVQIRHDDLTEKTHKKEGAEFIRTQCELARQHKGYPGTLADFNILIKRLRNKRRRPRIGDFL